MVDEVRIFISSSCPFQEKLEYEDAIGNGGYGVVISVNSKKVKELSGGFSSTTMARIEIFAITEGLKAIPHPGNAIVYLTNNYVLDALNKGWLLKWKTDGFKKKKHADLWTALAKVLYSSLSTVSFKHSREVRIISFFNYAEQLAKKMSARTDHPFDKKARDNRFNRPKPAPLPTLFSLIENNDDRTNKAPGTSTPDSDPAP